MYTKWLMENSFLAKTIKTFLVSIIILSMLSVTGCSLLPEEEVEELIPTITPPKLSQKPEYEVTTQTLETKVRGIGKIMSMQEEVLFFPGSTTGDSGNSSKRVKEVYVKHGDFVEQGALIAELDVVEMQNQLRREKLSFRTEELQMIEILRKADQMSAIELETAKINFEQARARLTEMEEEINRATIVAPFSGTITSLSVQKGDQVEPYDDVATIADLSQLTVAAEISKSDLQKIAMGMEAVVDINNAGQFKGKISQLPVEKEQNNNNYNPYNPNPNERKTIENYLLVELDQFPSEPAIGTPLSVSVIIDRTEDAVVIPLSALRSHGGRDYVQVIDADGSKREVDVEVGQKASTVVEIIKGLAPGQKVVGR